LPLAFVSTLLALSILAQASPTLAARFEQRLTGRVENVTGSALAGLGVSNGMTATVVIGVESTVSGTASPLGKVYTNAVLDFTVTVGGLQVTFSPPGLENRITVGDDLVSVPGLPSVDTYLLSIGPLTVPPALGPSASANMILAETPGLDAIPNDDAAQDLSGFLAGSVSIVATTNGSFEVDLDFGGGGGGNGARARQDCLKTQIGSGAAFCKAALACLSKQAKAPAKDPTGARLLACFEKAGIKFVAKFDGATDNAARRGGQCLSTDSGADAVLDLADDTDPIDVLVSAGADPNSKDDAKLRSALFKTASKAVDKLLKAEAKDAAKPDAAKLQKARDKVEAALVKAVDKAVAKAAKKGVLTTLTAQELLDASNDLVDSVLDLSYGN